MSISDRCCDTAVEPASPYFTQWNMRNRKFSCSSAILLAASWTECKTVISAATPLSYCGATLAAGMSAGNVTTRDFPSWWRRTAASFCMYLYGQQSVMRSCQHTQCIRQLLYRLWQNEIFDILHLSTFDCTLFFGPASALGSIRQMEENALVRISSSSASPVGTSSPAGRKTSMDSSHCRAWATSKGDRPQRSYISGEKRETNCVSFYDKMTNTGNSTVGALNFDSFEQKLVVFFKALILASHGIPLYSTDFHGGHGHCSRLNN